MNLRKSLTLFWQFKALCFPMLVIARNYITTKNGRKRKSPTNPSSASRNFPYFHKLKHYSWPFCRKCESSDKNGVKIGWLVHQNCYLEHNLHVICFKIDKKQIFIIFPARLYGVFSYALIDTHLDYKWFPNTKNKHARKVWNFYCLDCFQISFAPKVSL